MGTLLQEEELRSMQEDAVLRAQCELIRRKAKSELARLGTEKYRLSSGYDCHGDDSSDLQQHLEWIADRERAVRKTYFKREVGVAMPAGDALGICLSVSLGLVFYSTLTTVFTQLTLSHEHHCYASVNFRAAFLTLAVFTTMMFTGKLFCAFNN